MDLKKLEKWPFSRCGFLAEVDIPETVVKLIGNAAFQLCGRLERVVLTEGLESIGDLAFRQQLLKVDVPATVKRWKESVCRKDLNKLEICIFHGMRIFATCSMMKIDNPSIVPTVHLSNS
eukprot:scaffold2127_cov85-Cylindrotheca_fusiformis.AAC.8